MHNDQVLLWPAGSTFEVSLICMRSFLDELFAAAH